MFMAAIVSWDSSFALRFVDFFLCNEVRLLFEHLGQARIHEVRFVVGRLSANDFLIGTVDCGGRLLELGFEFGNFQDRQHFSSLHPIADAFRVRPAWRGRLCRRTA